ncbi:MAG: 50S ribosome-binding GTPase [Thiotrichales bacterium]|nr:50S ribosome-binding GTPase [Thiotrichales bacterium]
MPLRRLNWLGRFSQGQWRWSLALYGLPLLLFVGFSLYSLYQQDLLLALAVLSALASLLVWLGAWIGRWRKNRSKQQLEPIPASPTLDPTWVEPSAEWSEAEQLLWQQMNQQIGALLQMDANWSTLEKHAWALSDQVAQAYQKKPLQVSLPEMLLLTQQLSQRVRALLLAHLPFAEQLKLSQVVRAYRFYEDYADLGQGAYRTGMAGYRIARMLINPLQALAAEAKDVASGAVLTEFSDTLLRNLKYALLQEAVAVSIELYSGRYQVADSERKISDAAQQDATRMAADFEPLRVVLIGQISAGKSSLINALRQGFMAEVNLLPTTHQLQVYEFLQGGSVQMHLVDTPGLDNNEKGQRQLLQQMQQADLVLWLLRANQPAKQWDVMLKAAWDRFYQSPENMHRQKPPIIGVVTHLQRIAGLDLNQAPFNLQTPETQAEQTLAALLVYSQTLLDLPLVLPVDLENPQQPFGLELIEQALSDRLDQARNAQRNRQRLDSSTTRSLWRTQGKRLLKSSGALFQLWRKNY